MYIIITLGTLGPENNRFECSLKIKQNYISKEPNKVRQWWVHAVNPNAQQDQGQHGLQSVF